MNLWVHPQDANVYRLLRWRPAIFHKENTGNLFETKILQIKFELTDVKNDFSADQVVQDEPEALTFSQKVFYQTSWIHCKTQRDSLLNPLTPKIWLLILPSSCYTNSSNIKWAYNVNLLP